MEKRTAGLIVGEPPLLGHPISPRCPVLPGFRALKLFTCVPREPIIRAKSCQMVERQPLWRPPWICSAIGGPWFRQKCKILPNEPISKKSAFARRIRGLSLSAPLLVAKNEPIFTTHAPRYKPKFAGRYPFDRVNNQRRL